MAKISTSISLDTEVKDKAVPILNELGLDLSTAVGIFLRQTIRERKIPFEIRCDVPNAETRAALDEVIEMEKNPRKYKGYASFDELLGEVLRDA